MKHASSRTPSPQVPLLQLAHLHGVQSRYRDMRQRMVSAAPEALVAVLRALGVPLNSPADAAEQLRAARIARARTPLEPVTVAWDGRCPPIDLRLPEAEAVGLARLRVRYEDGQERERVLNLARLPRRAARSLDGVRFVQVPLRWPGRLPTGYHRLRIERGGSFHDTLILSAPTRVYGAGENRRGWGVFAPLYALHSRRTWGAGDFTELVRLVDWTADQGGQVTATLPLLPAFLGESFEPSPYSPVSRLFWNDFYLDLEAIPEWTAATKLHRQLERSPVPSRLRRCRAAAEVEYRGLMQLKRECLEQLLREFCRRPSARRDAFERYVARHPHADSYARFRATHERQGRPWPAWPTRLRDGELRNGDFDRAAQRYHLYAQWLAAEQMASVAKRARDRGVSLYLDLPLGAHTYGYDVWRFRDVFAQGATGGAPPDPVFTKGQDWGFVPLHPERLRETGYAYLIHCLRHHLSHARILRFDHVMALHRLYWVPTGDTAEGGAYVGCRHDELYALLSLESHRHQATIVGENLGTVPAAVNSRLRRHGVRGMYVVQYEAQPKPRCPLRPVPESCVASLNTHDMPPFQAYWEGLDMGDRLSLGLLKRSDLAGERRDRDRVRRGIIALMRRRNLLPPGRPDSAAVLQALIAHLGVSRAETVLLNLEDLWLERRSQNVPGTGQARPNWVRKTRPPFEHWRDLPSVQVACQRLAKARPRKAP